MNQHPPPRGHPGSPTASSSWAPNHRLTAAIILADASVPVTLLERHTAAHPLPRAVHLDDEVLRILHAVGSASTSSPAPSPPAA